MSPRPLRGQFDRLPAGKSPTLRALEKTKYFPSGDRYGEISSPGPLTFGPRFLAGVHWPSFGSSVATSEAEREAHLPDLRGERRTPESVPAGRVRRRIRPRAF